MSAKASPVNTRATQCVVNHIELPRLCRAHPHRGGLPRVPRCAGSAQLVADRPMLRS